MPILSHPQPATTANRTSTVLLLPATLSPALVLPDAYWDSCVRRKCRPDSRCCRHTFAPAEYTAHNHTARCSSGRLWPRCNRADAIIQVGMWRTFINRHARNLEPNFYARKLLEEAQQKTRTGNEKLSVKAKQTPTTLILVSVIPRTVDLAVATTEYRYARPVPAGELA